MSRARLGSLRIGGLLIEALEERRVLSSSLLGGVGSILPSSLAPVASAIGQVATINTSTNVGATVGVRGAAAVFTVQPVAVQAVQTVANAVQSVTNVASNSVPPNVTGADIRAVP